MQATTIKSQPSHIPSLSGDSGEPAENNDISMDVDANSDSENEKLTCEYCDKHFDVSSSLIQLDFIY